LCTSRSRPQRDEEAIEICDCKEAPKEEKRRTPTPQFSTSLLPLHILFDGQKEKSKPRDTSTRLREKGRGEEGPVRLFAYLQYIYRGPGEKSDSAPTGGKEARSVGGKEGEAAWVALSPIYSLNVMPRGRSKTVHPRSTKRGDTESLSLYSYTSIQRTKEEKEKEMVIVASRISGDKGEKGGYNTNVGKSLLLLRPLNWKNVGRKKCEWQVEQEGKKGDGGSHTRPGWFLSANSPRPPSILYRKKGGSKKKNPKKFDRGGKKKGGGGGGRGGVRGGKEE